MASDWFRKETWSASDEMDFRTRLKRARVSNRAQYMRIQAGHLAAAKPPLDVAAVDLLREMLANHPDESELSLAHAQLAESLARLGQTDGALEHYRAALQGMRDHPKYRNQAWAGFAWFVVEQGRDADRDEALVILDEFSGERMFPVDHFNWHGARAIILAGKGRRQEAQEAARLGLDAAAQTHSGVASHPRVALVTGKYAGRVRRVRAVLDPRPGWLARLLDSRSAV